MAISSYRTLFDNEARVSAYTLSNFRLRYRNLLRDGVHGHYATFGSLPRSRHGHQEPRGNGVFSRLPHSSGPLGGTLWVSRNPSRLRRLCNALERVGSPRSQAITNKRQLVNISPGKMPGASYRPPINERFERREALFQAR